MAEWNPQANDIFLKALELRSHEERRAFLDTACAGNPKLRSQVESLLMASDQAGSFLESPATALNATTHQSISEQPGTVIGPYKLLQQIGEGGMGVVYMAEQTEPVERRVALKIIKPGMDSRKIIARFEAERQALALMDHPNIAKVLDAGTTDSERPYFVMELVKGVTITEYCDEKHLTVRQRLELLLPVCQAVQHAHQKGIIHRDIKPSNVMVALYDGRPIPKVIDFGVAKATGSKLTDKTVFTEFGQVVGTVEYMSPEQAEFNQLDVDTRSDIYSLGVLLYELLTGTTPLERKRLFAAAFDDMLRIIREEEPPKPSTRLSTTNELASIAANRGLEPKQLSGLVRGELDWIVMKALEKNRSRRYETANGLAMDISRYLADEAVQACPPSAAYRFRKFARRNRTALTTAVLVSAALVLGTVASTWQAIRAEAARTAEADQRTIAEEQRNEAERQRAEADANFEQARKAVDDYFNTVSESKLLDVPGLEPLRKELLESALNYYEGFVDQHDDDPGRLADLVAAHLRVMVIRYSNGEGSALWFPHLMEAIEILEPLVREGHDTPKVQWRMAGWFRNNTDPRHWQSGGEEDRPALDRVLKRHAEIWEKFVRDNPDVPGFQNDLAGIYFYIAANQIQAGKIDEAARIGKRLLEIWEKLSHDYPQEPRYRLDLARVYGTFGRLQSDNPLLKKEGQKNNQKALALREQVVQQFPQVAGYRTQLGLNYSAAALDCLSENRDEAEQLSRKALAQFEKVAVAFPTMQSARIDLAMEYMRLGEILASGGKYADAIDLNRQSIGLWEGLASEAPDQWKNRTHLAHTWLNLAKALEKDGKPTEGDDAFRQATEISRIIEEDPSVGLSSRQALAWFYREASEMLAARPGQIAAAENARRHEMELWEQLAAQFPNAPNHRVEMGHSLWQLAILSSSLGRHDEAEKNHRRALDVFEKLAADDPTIPYYRLEQAHSYWLLGFLMGNTGRPQEAEEPMRQALALHAGLTADFPNDPEFRARLARSYNALIEMLLPQGKHAEVEETLRQAIKTFEDLGTVHPDVPDFKKRSVDFQDQLAKSFAERDQLREALAEARKAVRITPDDNALHDALLALLEKIGDKEQTLAVLRENVDVMPSSTMARQHLATALIRQGQLASAQEIHRELVVLFEKLAADHPNEPNYRVEMGHSLWQVANRSSSLGQQEEAEKSHRRALDVFEKLAADFPTVPFYRQEQGYSNWHVGFLMMSIGRSQDAEEPMRQALAIHAKLTADFPNEREYRTRLARSYNALIEALIPQGKQAEVGETLRQATKTFDKLALAHPDTPDFLRFRADSLHRLAQLQMSNKQVKEAEETGRQAIDAYQAIITRFPQHEDLGMVYMNLAPLFAGSDRQEEAADAYRNAFQQISNNVETLNYAAWTLATSEDIRLRNPKLAVEFAKKATELRPQDANFQNTLGVAHYRAGDWQDAIDWLDKSMKGRNGGDSNDWFFLAMSHRQLGHKDEARRWFDQAVAWMEKHTPHSEELLRFRREAEDLIVGKPAVNSEVRE